MKVNYKSVKGVLFFSLIFFGIFSHARWMNKKDASMKIEADTNISVKKDLSYSVTYDLKYHISTEQAKETLSIYTLRIIPDRQKFDLLKAQIILSDGKKVEVNREKIEFKDVSGAAKGFSSIKEIRIPLKQLQVGGQFHISYSIENFETQVENEFSFQYTFLTNGMHY
ncbi:MAG: DUF3857 domain-containing protein, partial [Bdellovibrionales bacterium]|nr:DUF3857 domain-containing protein [Bdellovibrionales bacterium]